MEGWFHRIFYDTADAAVCEHGVDGIFSLVARIGYGSLVGIGCLRRRMRGRSGGRVGGGLFCRPSVGDFVGVEGGLDGGGGFDGDPIVPDVGVFAEPPDGAVENDGAIGFDHP